MCTYDLDSDPEEPDFEEEEEPQGKPRNFDFQVVLVTDTTMVSATHGVRLHKKHEAYSALYNWHNLINLEHLMGFTGTHFATDDPKVRFYLVGHGNVDCMTLGNHTGGEVADAFAARILGNTFEGDFPGVLVSIVSCFSTAVSHYRKPDNFQNRLTDNFAAVFHRLLKLRHKVKIKVAARGVCVWVEEAHDGTIRKTTGTAVWDRDRQVYAPDANGKHHKYRGDKIIYYWVGDEQKPKYAY